MKKLLNIAGWIGGFALLGILLAFSGNCREQVRVEQIEVSIDYSDNQYFLTSEEVENLVREKYPYLDSLFCKEININLLEETLDNHPSIRKAEVYSALDGKLRIAVKQKRPVCRVQQKQRGYYLDEQGDSMALSDNYSASVPLVTGLLDDHNQQKVFEFLHGLENDPYFSQFFDGLHVEDDSTWVLYPRPGRHEVVLGKPENLDAKMHKLKAFYDKVVNTTNLESISRLNLAYREQVVCTKY